MNLDEELAAQHVGQSFQLQIPFWRASLFVTFLDLGVVFIPVAHVFLGLLQGLALHFEIAHAGGRRLIARAVHTLGILPAGKLDRARRIGKEHLIAAQSKFVLDHYGLAANHVGGAMQQQRSGHAAGKAAIDCLVLIVKGVHHHHLRRHRTGGFVHVIIERNVRM